MADDFRREWEENRETLSAQLYEELGAQNHFIGAFRNVIDWGELANWLTPLYRGKSAVGRPAHDASMLLRMLFLSYLYPITERQVEELTWNHMAVKYFLDLPLDEPPPDSNALVRFKARIIRGGNWDLLQRVYAEILRKGRDQGVVLGTVSVAPAPGRLPQTIEPDPEEIPDRETNSSHGGDVGAPGDSS